MKRVTVTIVADHPTPAKAWALGLIPLSGFSPCWYFTPKG